jgi:trehalose 6-phosphate synthase/phosphatase
MGIDAARFSELARSGEVTKLAASHRGDGCRLLVGLDRLDYTKGIPRRLRAFEALLLRRPELRGRVRLVQVAVPSREHVRAYRELRQEVDAEVGRIHGEFATPTWSPIHYLYRGLSQVEVVALYRAADAVLVTPLRDGMNLVAKEFVAARPDGDGVLVLSEFAGAAAELAEAVAVNPYDVEGMAEALHAALIMPEEERRTRMASLRDRVMTHDVHRWATSFVTRLEQREPSPAVQRTGASRPEELRAAAARLRDAARLVLLLDYDGTLVPFALNPELAVPDPELLALLRRLAAWPGLRLHVVSGRRRATLERWLGALPVGLHAEHGLWTRLAGGTWVAAEVPPATWRVAVLGILHDFADRTPGSLVEEKTAVVAWHYRAADPEYGAAQAQELSLHLTTVLANVPVEILSGDRVLEIRPHGIHKGRAVAQAVAAGPPGALVGAVGDDRTDEDMFAALPRDSVAVHVGPLPSIAPLRLPDVRAARTFLAQVVGG